MDSKRLIAWHRLITLTLLALALGIAVNTLEPAVLSSRVLELVPERKNAALGFITGAGLVVAMLVQPLFGALSDRTLSPWGRRIPYFLAGSLIILIGMYSVALMPTFLLVLLFTLLFQVGINVVQAPWQALIPDHVPGQQRGTASGIKSAFEILAFILGRRISGALIAQGNPLGAITVTALVLLVCVGLTVWVTRRVELERGQLRSETEPAPWREMFHLPWSEQPAFSWWFINRLVFWGGFIALNTFMIFFLIDVIGMGEDQAYRFFAHLSTVLGLCVLLATLPSGRLADRVGRKPLVMGSGVLATIGTVVLMAGRSTTTLYLAGAMLGLAAGVFLSANWALATDLVPAGESAQFLGIANIATAGGSFLSRFIGALLIEPVNQFTNSQTAGYLWLYGLTLFAFLFGILAVSRIPDQLADS